MSIKALSFNSANWVVKKKKLAILIVSLTLILIGNQEMQYIFEISGEKRLIFIF